MRLLLALWAAAAVFLVITMAAAWFVQRATGLVGWVDAFWPFGLGLAGVGVALLPLAPGEALSAGQALAAILIGLWGLRLGSHIARRAVREIEDARYAHLRAEWGVAFQPRLFGFLMLQASAGAMLVLSVLLAARNPAPGVGPQDLVATIVLLVALLGEALADRQLAAFKADPEHRGGVCRRGLWTSPRHPHHRPLELNGARQDAWLHPDAPISGAAPQRQLRQRRREMQSDMALQEPRKLLGALLNAIAGDDHQQPAEARLRLREPQAMLPRCEIGAGT